MQTEGERTLKTAKNVTTHPSTIMLVVRSKNIFLVPSRQGAVPHIILSVFPAVLANRIVMLLPYRVQIVPRKTGNVNITFPDEIRSSKENARRAVALTPPEKPDFRTPQPAESMPTTFCLPRRSTPLHLTNAAPPLHPISFSRLEEEVPSSPSSEGGSRLRICSVSGET